MTRLLTILALLAGTAVAYAVSFNIDENTAGTPSEIHTGCFAPSKIAECPAITAVEGDTVTAALRQCFKITLPYEDNCTGTGQVNNTYSLTSGPTGYAPDSTTDPSNPTVTGTLSGGSYPESGTMTYGVGNTVDAGADPDATDTASYSVASSAGAGNSDNVLTAITFENRSVGTLQKGVDYTPDKVTSHQFYYVHNNTDGTVEIVSGGCTGTSSTKFMRSTITGSQQRASLVVAHPAFDSTSDLRQYEQDWTSNRPDRWMGLCVRIGGSSGAWPYPNTGTPIIGYSNHSYNWRPGEVIDCGPCLGVRLPSGGTNWAVATEYHAASYPLARDFQQDIGNWVMLVYHIIYGSGGNGYFKMWLNGTVVYDSDLNVTCDGNTSPCGDPNISTFPDEGTYFGYEQLGLRNTTCTPNCNIVLDRDEVRYADGSDLSDTDGYNAVYPGNY